MSADAQLDDVRAAEKRWLSNHIPGPLAPRMEISLWPDAAIHPDDWTAIRTETVYVEWSVGVEIPVCFAFAKQ
jgi:hypothetical protein